jgi:hypothetical protein
MFAPLYSITPGMHVSVVNSYDAASLSVAVKVLRRVDYKQTKVYGNHISTNLEHIYISKTLNHLHEMPPT